VPAGSPGTAPIVALLVVVAVGYFLFALYQPFKGDGDKGKPVSLTIPVGASVGDIGDLLVKRGVVDSSFFFSLRARVSGDGGNVRSGRQQLREGMSYAAALGALTTPLPVPKTIKVTVPEGRALREIVPIVKQSGLRGGYVKGTKTTTALRPQDYGAPAGTTTLEGFLWPATYELKPGAPAKALVDQQLEAFKTNFAQVDLTRARRRKLSRYDVLIIASMIEREALASKDRRLVSAVIYNRLKDDIPLGIDATIRYRLNNFSQPLKVSELNTDSPFNTRKRQGLPPTPIGNPGLAALKAAANPANVDFLYYVVKPCGNGAHTFSSTDAQFQKDVAAYNAARAKRGGKDPSRC